MRIAASDGRQFFSALLIPMTTGVALALSAVYFGPRGPLVALLVNGFLMSQVAGVGRVVEITMPAGYFRLRGFERPLFYERLGIRPFKALMCSRLYRIINPDFRLEGGRIGLEELTQGMRSAEAAHAVLFVTVTAVSGVALLLRWFDAAAWLMLINILSNGYPVMLQRYNRLRAERLLR